MPQGTIKKIVSDRGFGFVTMEVSAEPGDLIIVHGQGFGFMPPSPTTGRYALGISLLSSRAPGPDGRNIPLGDATITIVAADGTTRAKEHVSIVFHNISWTYEPSP